MAQALYRTYRSKRLEDVIGQEHVTGVLAAALTAGKTTHAYLFTGPRGVGKTSVARIVAHQLNGLPYTGEQQHLDIIEIDAASNNGIDDVRDLRDKALIAPTSAPYKVYIIDEVHMLSKAAFNGLLKILEEPPAHVVFILATTDYDRLPDTIISRTQRFHFRLVPTEVVAEHLGRIAQQEGMTIDDDARTILAERGGGSVRDSLSLLDQLHSARQPITAQLVNQTLGLAPRQEVSLLLSDISAQQPSQVISRMQSLLGDGVGPGTLASQLATEIRHRLAGEPHLVQVLEKLAQVERASQPEVALLLALLATQPAMPAVQTAQVAPASVSSTAPAPLPHPAQATPAPITPSPSPAQAAAQQSTPAAARSKAPRTAPSSAASTSGASSAPPSAPTAKTASPAPDSTPDPTPQPAADLASFDHSAWLEAARQASMGLYAILAQASIRTQPGENTLTIYTGKKFNQTKLESAKMHSLLHQITRQVAGGEVTLRILGTTAPPRNAQAARVAEIMGGGEEVDV